MKRFMRTFLIALMILVLASGMGCRKKRAPEPATAPEAAPSVTTAPENETADAEPAPAEEPTEPEGPAENTEEDGKAEGTLSEEPAEVPAEEPAGSWNATQDAAEAMEGAGLNSLLFASGMIPKDLFGLELQGFRYMAGTLEADYANSANEAWIRVAREMEGFEALAEDLNSYSQSWETSAYGVSVQARGGQDRINSAVFDAAGLHFAVACNMGHEGAGVPVSAILSAAAALIPESEKTSPEEAPAEEPAEIPQEDSQTEETEAEIPDPWTETQDASEAIAGAGMNYMLLFSNVMPKDLFGLELQGFRYMAGTLEADYSNASNNAWFRISKDLEGFESLAGDFNAYSQAWEAEVYGITVHARGGQERVNTAVFDALGLHFAASCNPGIEGAGVPLSAVRSLAARARIPDSFLKMFGK